MSGACQTTKGFNKELMKRAGAWKGVSETTKVAN